jgi:hypothetical protein
MGREDMVDNNMHRHRRRTLQERDTHNLGAVLVSFQSRSVVGRPGMILNTL